MHKRKQTILQQINVMSKKGSSPVNPEAILQQDEISDNKPSKAAIIAKANTISQRLLLRTENDESNETQPG